MDSILSYLQSIVPMALKSTYSFYMDTFEIFIIAFLLIANTSYLFVLIMGYMNSRKRYFEYFSGVNDEVSSHAMLKPISMLAPCYNEENSIVESVLSLLRLNYSEFEVIVVNDGSSDKSLQNLIEHFKLESTDYRIAPKLRTKNIKDVYLSRDFPNLVVIDKENGGKADALNAGINYSKFPLVCCIDSDSILDVNGLVQISMPFFEDPQKTIAVGGTIRVVNDTKVEHGRVVDAKLKLNYLTIIQVVEYLRAFLIGRMGWDYINSNTIISGAFGIFLKNAVLKVGGYSTNTVGEDMELIMKLHAHCLRNKVPYRVVFLPYPVCWTEVPFDLKTLSKQRSRWQQGLIESLWTTKGLLFRPFSKQVGNIALPYLLFFEALSAPLELLSYIMITIGYFLGIMDPKIILLFLCVSILYGWILTLGAIIIEELTFKKYKRLRDYLLLVLGSMLEQFGFHQIHLYWRLKGLLNAILRKKSWGKMVRKGFKT